MDGKKPGTPSRGVPGFELMINCRSGCRSRQTCCHRRRCKLHHERCPKLLLKSGPHRHNLSSVPLQRSSRCYIGRCDNKAPADVREQKAPAFCGRHFRAKCRRYCDIYLDKTPPRHPVGTGKRCRLSSGPGLRPDPRSNCRCDKTRVGHSRCGSPQDGIARKLALPSCQRYSCKHH